MKKERSTTPNIRPSRKLHVYQNATGSTVIAKSLDEAIEIVRAYYATKGVKPTGLQYTQVPDKAELLVFETYAQRFVPLKADVWAKRIGKGVPNAEDK